MTMQVNQAKELTGSNESLAHRAIQAAIDQGVTEFCLCPGSRNSPFLQVLRDQPKLKIYHWFEERSATFFALGRSRSLQKPVAVITTSGSAAGELLPAAMEAHYTSTPLLLITADRPKAFRNSGAPQAAEHVGIFSHYVKKEWDYECEDTCNLSDWQLNGPAHLNVCFTEPAKKWPAKVTDFAFNSHNKKTPGNIKPKDIETVDTFLNSVEYPLVVVSALKEQARDPVIRFLCDLNLPVYFEGTSGIREDSRLQHLRITRSDNLWKTSSEANYPIDGVLRIGGVPTFRFWRDVEERNGQIKVCSINDSPFSGISWSKGVHVCLETFFQEYLVQRKFSSSWSAWKQLDRQYSQKLSALFHEEPQAEASLVYSLSKAMPKGSMIFLGNSLPIREWDLAAVNESNGFNVQASRGVNGIDGQLSTFLGLCSKERSNWGIFGDLTALYDMAAPWILPQLDGMSVNFVVINNGGGKIFDRMYEDKSLQNLHQLSFRPLADMWGLHYERWTEIPKTLTTGKNQLIEIVPNDEASNRFLKQLV